VGAENSSYSIDKRELATLRQSASTTVSDVTAVGGQVPMQRGNAAGQQPMSVRILYGVILPRSMQTHPQFLGQPAS